MCCEPTFIHWFDILDLDDDGRLKLYQRYRRSVKDKEALETVSCKSIRCLRLQCTVGPLTQHADEASVAFRGRIWVPTYSQLSISSPVLVSSKVSARISELPYIGSPSYDTLREAEVITQVSLFYYCYNTNLKYSWLFKLFIYVSTISLFFFSILHYSKKKEKSCKFFKKLIIINTCFGPSRTHLQLTQKLTFT